MLRRVLSVLVLGVVLGFLAFAVTLPQPAGDVRADAVVVLTGGEGRIARGLDVLRRGWSPRMLVSGVDTEVRPREFAAEYKVAPGLLACCITLGYESVDTRSNALEVAQWVRARHVGSIRLVTSDWHMRRAAWELRKVMPAGVTIIEDAVPTRPSLRILVGEYVKLVARRIYRMWRA
ncbi:MAG TPA: YdcF family protein [Novosphingobium sp.]|nr:YdcF family protein [Novosphingobium sp.]